MPPLNTVQPHNRLSTGGHVIFSLVRYTELRPTLAFHTFRQSHHYLTKFISKTYGWLKYNALRQLLNFMQTFCRANNQFEETVNEYNGVNSLLLSLLRKTSSQFHMLCSFRCVLYPRLY